MAEARLKAKWWSFTINNPTTDDLKDLVALREHTEYLVYQGEKCPDTGTIHYQGFVSLTSRDRMSALSKILRRAHWTRVWLTPDVAAAYCKKEESRVEQAEWNAYWHTMGEFMDADFDIIEEYGTLVVPVRGQAKPVSVAVKMITEGASLRDVAIAVPEAMASRGGGLRLLKEYYPAEAAIKARDVTVIVYFGPTGCGKSHKAITENPGCYVVRSTWWNGYIGQEVVIFDDFDPAMHSYTDMLNQLDIWQTKVPIKGSMADLEATTIILTSIVPPNEWYPMARGGCSELKRRIHHIYDLSGWKDYGRITEVGWSGVPFGVALPAFSRCSRPCPEVMEEGR